MAYDPNCYELAKYFIPSDPALERLREGLAQHIQNAVEEYITAERERLSAPVAKH